VIKTNQIAIADMGFLKESKGYKNLQIFTAGKAILSVELSNYFTCVNGTCTTKKDFNKRFFGVGHYKNIMDDILSGKPIYNRKNLKSNSKGFMQIIENKNFDITYRVDFKNIYFKDRLNGVLIKLERI
jgi:hypothetical protein